MTESKLDKILSSIKAGTVFTELNLSDCGLKEVPHEIFLPNVAEHVELINLGGNHLTSLPSAMESLHKIKILFFAGNQFESIPECLSKLKTLIMLSFKENKLNHISETCLSPSIRWLILTGNELTSLPKSIGACKGMRKLMLSLNKLSSLPEEMQSFHELELIRLAGNNFLSLPSWLFSLPNLSWIAYAGNPVAVDHHETTLTTLPDINWTDISVKEKLGEGASGLVYSCDCSSVSGSLAVKIFKSEGTSDGHPADEMKASIAAGKHPNCLRVLGKVKGSTPALLLPLIPPQYKPLGKPPSFDSITRDVYPPHTHFSLSIVLNILKGVIAVILHLHSKGIMHGDLYAHNILINQIGEPLLVDFGAATFFPTQHASFVEKFEVRAFGCLMDDLVERLDEESFRNHLATVSELRDLRNRCIHVEPVSRLTFSDLERIMNVLEGKSGLVIDNKTEELR